MIVEGLSLATIWGAIKGLPGVVRFVGPINDRRRLRQVLMDLGSLRFWSDGTLGPLRKIADGYGGETEQSEILSKLDYSEAGFRETIERLKEVRNSLLAPEINIKAADEVDKIIYKRIGPDAIRPQLRNLAKTGGNQQKEAAALVVTIEEFNRSLELIHDQIREKLPPKPWHKGATAARSRTRK